MVCDNMRVISGFLKGRNIKGYNIPGTRPTMDNVKESLFAMIQESVKDSVCLDLFAGSGSLGIEAISNGAKFVYFIDHNKRVINILRDNIKNFNIESFSKVILSDYRKALIKLNKESIKFDLIFLDPPYNEHIIGDILTFIIQNDMLNQNGQVICEMNNGELIESYNYLKLIKTRKYSDKIINIYIRKD